MPFIPTHEDEIPCATDWTPELSRRARGVPVYAALRSLGRSGLEAMVDRACELAQRMAGRLAQADGVQVVNDADLIELGIPSGDPTADGPVIRAAAAGALLAGATVEAVLDVARDISTRMPVIVMTYAATILAHGVDRFVDDLHDSAVSGLIVPDLPVEHADTLLEACDTAGIARVPVLAPSPPDDELSALATRARGFVYTISTSGPTGERDTLSADAAAHIARAHGHSPVPAALGFGISTPEHAAQAAGAGADGVIVGSRLVRAAAESGDPAAAVGRLVADLSAALATPTQLELRRRSRPAAWPEAWSGAHAA